MSRSDSINDCSMVLSIGGSGGGGGGRGACVCCVCVGFRSRLLLVAVSGGCRALLRGVFCSVSTHLSPYSARYISCLHAIHSTIIASSYLSFLSIRYLCDR